MKTCSSASPASSARHPLLLRQGWFLGPLACDLGTCNLGICDPGTWDLGTWEPLPPNDLGAPQFIRLPPPPPTLPPPTPTPPGPQLSCDVRIGGGCVKTASMRCCCAVVKVDAFPPPPPFYLNNSLEVTPLLVFSLSVRPSHIVCVC